MNDLCVYKTIICRDGEEFFASDRNTDLLRIISIKHNSIAVVLREDVNFKTIMINGTIAKILQTWFNDRGLGGFKRL